MPSAGVRARARASARALALAALGLVGLLAPSARAATPTTLRGKVGFDASYYELGFPSAEPLHEGKIPSGTGPLAGLMLCAYATRGFVDAASGQDNDLLLGCDRAADDGAYAIDFDADALGVTADDEVYLLTWYCDGLVGGASLTLPAGEVLEGEAHHCVRLNAEAGLPSWASAPDPSGRRVKHTWSRRYPLTLATLNQISWNLSCPAELRAGVDALVGCADGAADPWMPATCAGVDPGRCAGAETATNSDAGYNREAVHLFRAAAQSPFFLADEATTAEGARPWRPLTTPTIELFIGPATLGGITPRCDDRAEAIDLNGDRREACIDSASLASPFVVLHEIGHLLHARWIDSPGKYGGGLECVNPTDGDGDEIRRTNEGFADFYAAAMWFDAGDPGAFWGRRDRLLEDSEGAWVSAIACPASGGERREAQFFWDLYDLGEDQVGEAVDRSALSVAELLAVWSHFTLPCGGGEGEVPANRHASELGCAARNVADFAYHLDALHGAGAAAAATTINCMGAYTDPGAARLCPAESSVVDPEEFGEGACGCRGGEREGAPALVALALAIGRRRRRRGGRAP